MKQPQDIDSHVGSINHPIEHINKGIISAVDTSDVHLRTINEQIHKNPELGYEEFLAHDNIVSLLQSLDFRVTPHAYGLETALEAEYGTGGRVVVFNAEYDALPDIGHACGHNLIATSSIAAFIGLASALKASNICGRVRLLGTPAEEGGGGKCKLIDAGAYRDVDACLMVHPGPSSMAGKPNATTCESCGCIPAATKHTGQAYTRTLANKKFNARFTGRPAHAALAPFQGLNALDGVVLAYNGVSMLRQQTRPTDRIHSVILEGGTRPNIITASATTQYYVRSTTLADANALKTRVVACLEGAAMATGTKVDCEAINEYADLRPNKTICSLYADAMKDLGSPVLNDPNTDEAGLGSTDQGNVSYEVPAFHGVFAIPCPKGAFNHTPGFTACAGTEEAYKRAVVCGKGMALAGWRILAEEKVAEGVRRGFEEDMKGLDEEETTT